MPRVRICGKVGPDNLKGRKSQEQRKQTRNLLRFDGDSRARTLECRCRGGEDDVQEVEYWCDITNTHRLCDESGKCGAGARFKSVSLLITSVVP